MSYCPILSYQRDATATKYCMGIDCEFADEAGECLIKQALSLYVSGERTRRAEEVEKSRRDIELTKQEVEMALGCWEYMKNSNLRKADRIIEDLSPCIDQVIDSI